ncbi:MAG: putative 2OG-Fe(II) oxygenase [Gammaproteobacteria bacterium]
MNIGTYFAVPVSESWLPDAEALNARLKPKLLYWESHEGQRRSIPTTVAKHAVYESDFYFFERDDPDVKRLAQYCLSQVGEIVARINGYGQDQVRNLRIFSHSWYHITRHGGYTGPHNHPMASWSGVYCLTPGEEPEDHAESGVLRLLDPRPGVDMYLDPGNAHLKDPFGTGTLPWRLKPGQLVLFPSYLHHEVTPFWGRDERITVAFNAWVREAGQTSGEPGVKTF